jgi:hypothetical protein
VAPLRVGRKIRAIQRTEVRRSSRELGLEASLGRFEERPLRGAKSEFEIAPRVGYLAEKHSNRTATACELVSKSGSLPRRPDLNQPRFLCSSAGACGHQPQGSAFRPARALPLGVFMCVAGLGRGWFRSGSDITRSLPGYSASRAGRRPAGGFRVALLGWTGHNFELAARTRKRRVRPN